MKIGHPSVALVVEPVEGCPGSQLYVVDQLEPDQVAF